MRSILIVDSDNDCRLLLSKQLESTFPNLTVYQATNISEAKEQIFAHPIDLILDRAR